MTSSNELPVKCRECAKAEVLGFHRKCHFCRDLEFQESVLCDLNRCVQDRTEFQCHAFEPRLKVVSSPENRENGRLDPPQKRLQKESYLKLFHSDKIKYERALALQKLSRDPEGVYVQLKYHLSWNVTSRIAAFNPTGNFIDSIHDIFFDCSHKIGGFVHLLYLAADHVHIFVESDGELSVEEMVHRIKGFTKNTILEEISLLREKFRWNIEIWDDAYFVETVS